MKNTFVLFLVAITFLSGCISTDSSTKGTTTTTVASNAEETAIQGSLQAVTTDRIIKMTSGGFEPDSIVINVGETVTFVNEGMSRWPASAMHPSHARYPGSGIEKCGTAEEAGIFDACSDVETSYSFIFNKRGKWFYHDHSESTRFGSITVE